MIIMKRTLRRTGFTLIEVVITLALVAILTSVYILVANPAGQLAGSRNNRRTADLQDIALAIRANIADTGTEQINCAAGAIPTTTTIMGTGSGKYNIAPCLMPTYLVGQIPVDPNASSAYYTSITDYNTGYAISENASGTITLSAPNAELKKTITISE